MEWIYFVITTIVTVSGWIFTNFLSSQQNIRYLKQQTKIETIKYIHQIKKSLQESISTPQPDQVKIGMDIRQIRNLLKDVIHKKKINQFKNLLIEVRIKISQLDTSNISKQEINKIKEEILLSLNILNTITLMYPFNN